MRWELPAFGLDRLTCVDDDPGEPGPGEVRLGIRAVSLNYRDLLMVAGEYDARVPLPLVPCSDAVGVVEAVGPGVDLPIGSRRMPAFSTGWRTGPPKPEHLRTTLGGPLHGTLRRAVVVHAGATVPVPDGLDDVEACTLPCAAVTAWHALELAGVTTGSTVLTLGTGGVSVFALQLAVARGARVAVTSRSAAKRERALALGAEVAFDTAGDWGRQAQRWSGGVDAVIEVGGAGTLAQSLRAVRVGGTIALIGVLAGSGGDVPLVSALMRSVRIQGVFVGSAEHLAQVCRAVHTAGIRPVVDRVVPFARAPDAFAALQAGGHFGKVVISDTVVG